MFKFDFFLDVENLNDNLLEAEKIVNTCGSIFEKEHKTPGAWGSLFAIPISKLPYTKKEIKTAIKFWLLTLMLDGKWDDPSSVQKKETLKIGYFILADFIDDDKAKVVIDFWKPFFEDIRRQPKKTTEEVLEIFEACKAEICEAIEAKLKEMDENRPRLLYVGHERVQEIQDKIREERSNLLREIDFYCEALSALNEISKKEPDMFLSGKFRSNEKAIEILATVVYLYNQS